MCHALCSSSAFGSAFFSRTLPRPTLLQIPPSSPPPTSAVPSLPPDHITGVPGDDVVPDHHRAAGTDTEGARGGNRRHHPRHGPRHRAPRSPPPPLHPRHPSDGGAWWQQIDATVRDTGGTRHIGPRGDPVADPWHARAAPAHGIRPRLVTSPTNRHWSVFDGETGWTSVLMAFPTGGRKGPPRPGDDDDPHVLITASSEVSPWVRCPSELWCFKAACC